MTELCAEIWINLKSNVERIKPDTNEHIHRVCLGFYKIKLAKLNCYIKTFMGKN